MAASTVGRGESSDNRRQLAAELLRLRDQAGFSGRELAQRIRISQSKVSRIESGSTIPAVPEVVSWAEAVGATTATRNRLVSLTEAVYTEVHSWRRVLSERAHLQDEIEEREARARTVRTFQPSLIPGLLQTADYARRVFALFQVPYTEDNAAAALAGRLHRQLALYEEHRQFEFLITEAALRWCPGPGKLLLAQYDRIASLSTLDNVSIGLIPQGGPAVTSIPHGFVIYDGHDGDQDTIVSVETVHANVITRDPDDVSLYENRWSLLRQMAMFGEEVCKFLSTLPPRVG